MRQRTHLTEPGVALKQQLHGHWSGVAEPEEQLGGGGAAAGETGGRGDDKEGGGSAGEDEDTKRGSKKINNPRQKGQKEK